MKELNLVLFVSLAIISALGCARPPNEGSPSAQSNGNDARKNANAEDLTATPLYASTIRGDVERAGLAVTMAHDFVKQQKWAEAAAQLRAAQSQIEKALERKPRLQEDFEAASGALSRAITTVENHGSDIEARFTELQARIGALKAYTSE